MRRQPHLVRVVCAALFAVTPLAHADLELAPTGDLTQISVESSGEHDVFHLLDLEQTLGNGKRQTITAEDGTTATAQMDGDALLLSMRGFDYRLPLALLPRRAEVPALEGQRVTVPGREYRMTFARGEGMEDVVRVQRRFTGSID